MKFAFCFLLLTFSLAARAVDDTSCESHKEGEDSVMVCKTGNHTFVTRCNHDASHCESSESTVTEDTVPDLIKFCEAGIDVDCGKLANQLSYARSLCDEKFYRDDHPDDCKHSDEERKHIEELVAKYNAREEAKRAAKTLDLCEKHVFDKDYCDSFKQKLQAKAKPAATPTPTPAQEQTNSQSAHQ